MERDLDDTVIRPVRPVFLDDIEDLSDTIVQGEVPAHRVSSRHRAESPLDHDPPEVPQQPPAALPRYGFRINVSEPVGLDRPAYIGRKPSPPRIVDAAPPRMVTVPSPLGEVSGTHLELRMQGTMVIATDLKSTNGTSVSIPGAVPVRLRQNDSIVVSPGTLIKIGDDNVIEILSMRRVHPSRQNPGAAHS